MKRGVFQFFYFFSIIHPSYRTLGRQKFLSRYVAHRCGSRRRPVSEGLGLKRSGRTQTGGPLVGSETRTRGKESVPVSTQYIVEIVKQILIDHIQNDINPDTTYVTIVLVQKRRIYTLNISFRTLTEIQVVCTHLEIHEGHRTYPRGRSVRRKDKTIMIRKNVTRFLLFSTLYFYFETEISRIGVFIRSRTQQLDVL